METINAYNLIKNAIWNCVLEADDESIPRSEQQVNLVMLRDILLEMNSMIQFVHLHVHYETRMSDEGRQTQLNAKSFQANLNYKANKQINDILKRFSVIDPRQLQNALLAKENKE